MAKEPKSQVSLCTRGANGEGEQGGGEFLSKTAARNLGEFSSDMRCCFVCWNLVEEFEVAHVRRVDQPS